MIKKKTNGSAPAIVYASMIIEHMRDGAEHRIQDLVNVTGAPKSSILRYLTTLEKLGAIWKNPVKRTYKCNIRIVVDAEENPVFEKKRKAAMHELCDLTHRTVEWFEPAEEGMVLCDRISPSDHFISAKVGIGANFSWNKPLEAVRILGNSRLFINKIPNDIVVKKLISNGVAVPILPAEINELLQETKDKKVISDEFCNSFGTRRIAAVIEKAGKFIGILAVIEVVLHADVAQNLNFIPALERQAEILSS